MVQPPPVDSLIVAEAFEGFFSPSLVGNVIHLFSERIDPR